MYLKSFSLIHDLFFLFEKSANPQVQVEKDLFMYRAFIAQKKYGVVLDDIKQNAPEELRFIRLLADYLANESKRETIVSDLDAKIGSLSTNSSSVLLIIAMIYYLEENYEFALKILHNADDSLECSALAIQVYLKIDRIDLARKELKKLQELDEDALVTQLANTWVNLVSGEKIQDAFFTFQEQSDKHSSTSVLLNSQAVCLITQGKFEEAQSLLQEALDKDSNNPDIMVNMVVLNQYLGKPAEVTNRYLLQLKDTHKNHPFVKDLLQKENEFNRLAKNYQQSVAH
jgi:coatomer subunit epsilon